MDAISRRGLALALVLALLTSAGCVGFVTGNGPLTFEASPASATNATLSETGYHLQRQQSMEMNRTVSVAGQSRSVHVTNYVAVYARSADVEMPADTPSGPTGGMVVVVSTPKASVAGQGLNPLGTAPIEKILTLVPGLLPGSSSVQRVEQVRSRPVTMLGSETTLRTFEVTAERDGTTATSSMALARVEDDGDYVLVLAVFPPGNHDDDGVVRLLDGLRH